MNDQRMDIPSQPEDKLFSELKEIYSSKFKNEDKVAKRASYDKCVNFANQLRTTYGGEEIEKYRAFHIISGSTPDENIVTHFDLPDGEIERFIREQL